MTPRDADPLRPPETDRDGAWAEWNDFQAAAYRSLETHLRRRRCAITVLAILSGLAILLLTYVAAEASRAMTDTADPVLSSPGAPHRSGGVSSGAVAVPAAAPTSGTVASLCKPSPCPTLEPVRHMSRSSVDGTASWFAAPDGQAAAGPGLRRALGSGWRGTRVRVCAGRCVSVVLSDFCRCPDGKVIDLDDGLFARLAPLGRGLVAVRVSW